MQHKMMVEDKPAEKTSDQKKSTRSRKSAVGTIHGKIGLANITVVGVGGGGGFMANTPKRLIRLLSS